MRLDKFVFIFGIFLISFGMVVGYSTYGSPTEFGNETHTTAYFGGDLGELNISGNAQINGTMMFLSATSCESVGTNCFTVQVNGSIQTCVCFDDSSYRLNTNHSFLNGTSYFSDKVGIGTTVPIANFHTIGSTTNTQFIGLFAENGITPENSVASTIQRRMVSVQGDGGALFMGRDVTNDIEFLMGTSILGEAFVGAMTSHDMSLRTDNVDRLTVKATTGNVGIGTTSPGSILDVTNGNIRITNTTSGTWDDGNVFGGVEFYTKDATTTGVNAAIKALHLRAGTGHSYSDAGLGFYTSDTADTPGGNGPVVRMVINNGGNVGIGTTSPSVNLEVSQSGIDNSGSVISIANRDTSISENQILGTLDFATNYETSLSQVYTPLAQIKGIAASTITGTSTTSGKLQFFTTLSNVPTQRMVIDSSGNVGIGTTSPQQKLDVDGTISISTIQPYFILNDTTSGEEDTYLVANSHNFYINFDTPSGTNAPFLLEGDTGNVGIGTTAPGTISGWDGSANTILNVLDSSVQARIVVQGDAGAFLDLVDSAGGSNDKWLSLVTDGGVGKFRTIKDDGSAVQTENILVMDLGTGNVGIGTSSPGYKLDVNISNPNVPGIRLRNTYLATAGDFLFIPEQDGAGGHFTFGAASVGYDGSNNPDTLTSNLGSRRPGIYRYRASATELAGHYFGTATAGSTQTITWNMVVQQSGKVGIGTTVPGQKLQVTNGGFMVNNTGNASLFFVDNTTGNVGIGTTSPQNKLNIIGDFNQTNGNSYLNNIYGEMWYYNDTGTELDFAIDGTFYNLFMTNATYLNGFTYEGDFNQISNLTVHYPGKYQANFNAIGDGQNNHIYETAIFVNGVIYPSCIHTHKMAVGGDIVTHSSSCLLELSSEDVVDIRTADIGGTGTGNYYGADLNLLRVGN